VGPHIYPTTQGPTDLERASQTDRRPSKALLVEPVYWTDLPTVSAGLPLPPSLKSRNIQWYSCNLHLFGTTGRQFIFWEPTSRVATNSVGCCMEVELVSASVGRNCDYVSPRYAHWWHFWLFWGWVDGVVMRLVEVLMTIPAFIYWLPWRRCCHQGYLPSFC